jgi:peptide/nickel transport system permease protein
MARIGLRAARAATKTPDLAELQCRLGKGRKRVPVGAMILLAPLVVFGVFGSLIAPHETMIIDSPNALRPPAWMDGGSWSYLLGTDKFGRDLLSVLIVGARTSLIVTVIGVLFAGAIGVTLGLVAGYFGKWVDNLIMRIVDVFMSVPGILFMLLLAAALGPGIETIIISMGFLMWCGYTRVMRGEVLSVKERDFVAMAKVMGVSRTRILVRHILPSVGSTVVVMASLQAGGAIMMEGGLSFLGLGVQPPYTTWGRIIAENKNVMTSAWWIPVFAGLLLIMAIWGFNLLGDWLRDVLDPKMRRK